MKSNIKQNLTLFLHEDTGECIECLNVLNLFDTLKGHFKRKGVYLTKIKDDSYQEIFMNDRFPLLRIEGMPPKHYSGLQEIQDYISSCKYN